MKKFKFSEFKKTRLFSFILILIFIAVCIGIGSGIAFVKHSNNATDIAATYFRAFIQKDYDEMYDHVYNDHGYHIDKNVFVNRMKKLRKQFAIDTYDVGELETKNGIETITIKIKETGHNNVHPFILRMKSARKGLMIIPTYYVEMNPDQIKDMTNKNHIVIEKFRPTLNKKADKIIDNFYKSAKAKKMNKALSKEIGDNKDVKKKFQKELKYQIKKYYPKGKKKKRAITKYSLGNVERVVKKKDNKLIVETIYYNKYTLSTKTSVSNSYSKEKKYKVYKLLKLTYEYKGDNLKLTDVTLYERKK